MRIDLDGMVSIPYLKKAVFTGSCRDMRFLLRKQSSEEDGDKLQGIIWPGPYNFASTEEEKKVYKEFSFSRDGIDEAAAWLNEYYEEKFAGVEEDD